MRVLFASTRGAGHFNPLVPFIEAVRRDGGEVLVAGPPPLAASVENAGYPLWMGQAPPEDELGEVWARVPAAPRDEAEQLVVGEIFARLNVRAMLPALESACAEWRPDLVLRDTAEYASAIAAERAGIPHARVGVSLSGLEEQMLAVAGPRLEEQEPGIAGRISASPYLTVFPGSLEDPEVPQPSAIRRCRAPGAAVTQDPLPDWWPGDGRPLVYVSFGSVTGTVPFAGRLYADVLEAVADLPARVLLTIGHETDRDALGAAPANVRIEPWVPQEKVLGQAAAVVCHGGSGTTLGALAAGVPLVVVPLFADQPENARRVAAVGAGVAVEDAGGGAIRTHIDAAAAREAVERVLSEASYRETAGAIGREMASLPPIDGALIRDAADA